MTTTNGNDGAARRPLSEMLHAASAASAAAAHMANEPATEATEADDVPADVAALAMAMAERVATAGRYAREHGQYLEQRSIAFAERIQAMVADYAGNMLAAERRKMSELEKILGKTGK